MFSMIIYLLEVPNLRKEGLRKITLGTSLVNALFTISLIISSLQLSLSSPNSDTLYALTELLQENICQFIPIPTNLILGCRCILSSKILNWMFQSHHKPRWAFRFIYHYSSTFPHSILFKINFIFLNSYILREREHE